jgi:spore cortex formation protein SpoVR/YcgB (stage V sporulation)
MGNSQLLYSGSEWDFDRLRRAYDCIEQVALDEMGLNTYRNQIEVITSEQMLDASESILPEKKRSTARVPNRWLMSW